MNPLSTRPLTRRSGFTLIELMVVIAIIALLSALVAGLATRSSEKKVNARAQVLIKQVEMAIDDYKDQLGFLPPDNTNNVARPPLYYSLRGSRRSPDGTQFTMSDGQMLTAAALNTEFGIGGLVNSVASGEPVKDFASNLKESHVEKDSNGFRFIVIPFKGPDGEFNPVRYDASSATRRNLTGYDLWVEVVVGGKTNIIGNW